MPRNWLFSATFVGMGKTGNEDRNEEKNHRLATSSDYDLPLLCRRAFTRG